MQKSTRSARQRAITVALATIFAVVQSHLLAAQPRAIQIVGSDESYQTIQEAIDASPPGAVVEIPAGQFDERLTISKQVTLVGAGVGKTIIGPTATGQANLRDTYERLAEAIDEAARAAEEAGSPESRNDPQGVNVKQQYETMKQLYERYAQPVVAIRDAKGVALRSLTITMPDTPQEGAGLLGASAIAVESGGGVGIDGCAVVGCLGSGISAEKGAALEVANSLVAACWGAGISIAYSPEGAVRIVNCDVRNNYHYNIAAGTGFIERCRISGSAWSGIRGSATRVERNVIFDNARSGIYSVAQEATVEHNLIVRNGLGASCWADDRPLYQHNVFLDNVDGGVYANGPCEPVLRGNLIVGSPIGVRFGPMKIAKGERPPASEFHVVGNIFWKVESPLVLFTSNDPDAKPQGIPLTAVEANRVEDPQVSIEPDKSVVFAADSLVEELGLQSIAELSLRSPWPLTPEEKAMIPDDGTRDSPKWKQRPRR